MWQAWSQSNGILTLLLQWALIAEEVEAFFAGCKDIFPTVSIDVLNPEVESGTAGFVCGAVVYGDTLEVPLVDLVVIETEGVISAGVISIVCTVTLARDEFIFAVFVDIDKFHGVELRLFGFDDVLGPGAFTVFLRSLFQPVETVVMALADENVVFAVFIYIMDEYGDTGGGDVPFAVKGIGIGGRRDPSQLPTSHCPQGGRGDRHRLHHPRRSHGSNLRGGY